MTFEKTRADFILGDTIDEKLDALKTARMNVLEILGNTKKRLSTKDSRNVVARAQNSFIARSGEIDIKYNPI